MCLDLTQLHSLIIPWNQYFKKWLSCSCNFRKRSISKIPKKHFKFFYLSPFDESESYVLLDILFGKSPYAHTITTPIESPFIENKSEPRQVLIPDISSLLGDKLTAFAPNTIGIPYENGKEMEIIKQLFDIETLFDQSIDLEIVKGTFIKCANQELNYRNFKDIIYSNVLDDILETSLVLGGRGSFEKETFLKLEDGIRRIKTHIIDRNYIVEEAVKSASKAAYLSQLIKSNAKTIERFDASKPLPTITGDPLFKRMPNIKKFSPEAYYYFTKTQEIIRN